MKNTLTKQENKMINRIFWRSGLLFGSFNSVKMQGQGFAYTMIPAINECYKDDEKERTEALKRSNEFFNCHSSMAGFIYGLVYAMERDKAQKKSVDGATITNVKTALMGPLAGIGDSLFFNTIRVIAASIAISLCATGNLAGVLLFMLLYGGTSLLVKYLLIRSGYSLGSTFIERVFNSGLLEIVTKAASTLGLVMVGAMVASMVSVKLGLTWTFGGTEVVIQDVLDSIMPGILSLAVTFGVVKLLKKGYNAAVLVTGLLVACIILAAFGIF